MWSPATQTIWRDSRDCRRNGGARGTGSSCGGGKRIRFTRELRIRISEQRAGIRRKRVPAVETTKTISEVAYEGPGAEKINGKSKYFVIEFASGTIIFFFFLIIRARFAQKGIPNYKNQSCGGASRVPGQKNNYSILPGIAFLYLYIANGKYEYL